VVFSWRYFSLSPRSWFTVLTKDFVSAGKWLWRILASSRLAAIVAHDKGRAKWLRRVRRHEIVLAIGAGIIIGLASADSWVDRRDSDSGLGDYCRADGKDRRPDVECLYITVAVVVGMHSAGRFSLLDLADRVPAIVFFPAYAIYFFAGEVSAIELGPLSARHCKNTCDSAHPATGGIEGEPTSNPQRIRFKVAPDQLRGLRVGHENLRPTMHFTMRWSVERSSRPDSEVELPLRGEIDIDRREELLLLISKGVKAGQRT